MKLKDLKIIVTGGAQGMGAHFATRLAEAGAQVAVGDVNEAALAERCPRGHPPPQARRRRTRRTSRPSSPGRTARWAASTASINNAGILRDGLLVKKDRDDRRRSRSSRRERVERGHRRQPHRRDADGARGGREDGARPSSGPASSSTCRRIARHGNRGQSNYVAAKAALAANTVTWAREFAAVRHPRRRGRPGHDRDADDPGHEPEGARRAGRQRSRSAASACPRTSGWR